MQRFFPILLAMLTALAAACAQLPTPGAHAPDVLLLGEQHDVPEHQRLHHQTVGELVRQGRLVALAIEMAERGVSTAGLARHADEDAVRAALRWDDKGWPWPPYAPAIMAAVRAGVPVLGANLPRHEMRAAMADENLDRSLPADALARQRAAIRVGHCGLLPEAQIAPMTRIQIARDRTMAALLAGQVRRGGTVVLLAGSGHVDQHLGVPRHLPPNLRVEPVMWPAVETAHGQDHCAELRQRFGPAR